MYALRNHVNVIRELPEDVLQRFDNNISNIVNLRVKAWSSPKYYLDKVLPKLQELKYGFLPSSFFFFSLSLFISFPPVKILLLYLKMWLKSYYSCSFRL